MIQADVKSGARKEEGEAVKKHGKKENKVRKQNASNGNYGTNGKRTYEFR